MEIVLIMKKPVINIAVGLIIAILSYFITDFFKMSKNEIDPDIHFYWRLK